MGCNALRPHSVQISQIFLEMYYFCMGNVWFNRILMKRIFKAAVLSAIFSLLSMQAYSQSIPRKPSGEGLLIDGVAAYDKGDCKAAKAIFRKLTEMDAGNDAAWYYTGLCDLRLRDAGAARDAFRKASVLDPANYWYRERLAHAYSLAGEDELTVATYEDMLKDFPKKNELYFNLVNLYLQQGQLDKALGAMDQIETVFGKNETVTATKYEILLRQNKPEEAVDVLRKFNDEYSSPRILAQLGDHAMAEYKDSAALSFYQEALGLQSGFAPALLGLAEVYRTRRDYPPFFDCLNRFVSNDEIAPEIKSQYLSRLFTMLFRQTDGRFMQSFRPQLDSVAENCVSHHPSDSSVLTAIGLYYSSSDRLDKAADLFRRNLRANPESISAEATYIQMLSYMRRWDDVLAECDSALARFPRETAFLDMKSAACYQKKDFEGILDNCRRIISLAPDDTSKTLPAMATMADIYHETGAEKEAFKLYKKVLKLDPDRVPVLNNYAYYLSLRGKQLKKAYRMSRKTVDREPDNPIYLDTLGWILHLLGRDSEAKTHFKHAMLYGGKESATCLGHYAQVLESLGETDLAKVYRSQAEEKAGQGKE